MLIGQAGGCEPPDAVCKPRDAVRVGLDRHDQHPREHRRERGLAIAHERGEQREVPRDEEQRAEQTRLDAQFGVVRFSGLDRDVLAERDLAGVAEAVSLRVVGDGVDPVPELAQVGLGGGLELRRTRPVRLRALVGKLTRREMGSRADVGENREEGQADGEPEQRGASVRPEEPRGGEGGKWDRESGPRGEQQRDEEEERGAER